MDKNLKSTSIPKSQQKGKTPTFRVQTGVRAGRARAGAAVRERLRSGFDLPTFG